MMTPSIAGKKVLITGSTRGIGKDIATILCAQGAIVGITGRNQDAIISVAKELGTNAIPLNASDATNHGAIPDFMDKSIQALGGIDALVNNAGITNDMLVLRMKEKDFTDVLDVNLTAPFLYSQAVLKPMMKQRSGRIIYMSSIIGSIGAAGQANYSASKGGIVALTKSMARELASRNITVNAIAPGFIDTDMTSGLEEAHKEAILKNIPLGRMGTGADIAHLVAFLLSDASSYITGQTLHVNGGLHMA